MLKYDRKYPLHICPQFGMRKANKSKSGEAAKAKKKKKKKRKTVSKKTGRKSEPSAGEGISGS